MNYSKILRSHGKKLSLLRTTVERRDAATFDETILTVAVIDVLELFVEASHVEPEQGDGLRSIWGSTHAPGMMGILTARPTNTLKNEMTRALRLLIYGSTSLRPIGQGIPSPVDGMEVRTPISAIPVVL